MGYLMTLMFIEKFLRKYIIVIKYQKMITYLYKPLPKWVLIFILRFTLYYPKTNIYPKLLLKCKLCSRFDIVLIENLIEYTIDKGNRKKCLNNNYKCTNVHRKYFPLLWLILLLSDLLKLMKHLHLFQKFTVFQYTKHI